MLIRNPGRVTTLSAVEPGTLFSVKYDGAMCIALAIEPLSNQPNPDALLLSPGHPDLHGAPGVLAHSRLIANSIFAFNDATIEYLPGTGSIKLGEWNIPNSKKPLYLCDETPYIKFISQPLGNKTVDLLTGTLEDADLNRAAAIFGWRIVWTDSRGDAHQICSF